MIKRVHFSSSFLPYLLVLPQVLITLVFFIWPASQAVFQSFLQEDPFGLKTEFIFLENYYALFQDPDYRSSFFKTMVFSFFTTLISMGSALILAARVDRVIKYRTVYRTFLIWPYAVAPVVAGALWMFMFDPTLGIVAYYLQFAGVDWNHRMDGNHAMILIILAASWKQISYNFLFFIAGMQAIPRSLIEAAAMDGAGPFRRFWTIVFPLLSPTTFFLLVVNMVYAFFDTFGIVHAVTKGGPAQATQILVYKVFNDGFIGLDLGGSAAQSVILMAIVIGFTVIQFKYIERRVVY
ncbi:MAG: sn-glycerol-3-phosphate ABC transporter permease UgpA [Desulfotignum sp.]